MVAKNKIWFKKISSAFLLLNLIAITAIQVFHTHPSGAIPSHKKTDAVGFYKTGADSKCFICDYQLTKDADANHAAFTINAPIVFNVAAPISFCFTAQDIQTVFETRGPPAV